jgi:anaerobic magnesium-protoporphyrin IX monomethyl ester cyclase
MKILIVVPNFLLEPIGLAYISAVLKKEGHEVDVLKKSQSHLLGKVLSRGRYDFVATGGLSLHFNMINNLLDAAKKARVKTIVGGGIVTSEPELMTRALNADYSVIGEGEETVVELLDAICRGKDLEAVRGIGFLNKDKFVLTEPRKPIEDLDSLPVPDWDGVGLDEVLDRQKGSDGLGMEIFDYPRAYTISMSRSCPFLCTFCYHPLGNKYRKRSVESIMKELEISIPKYRINMLGITDELFSNNKERVYDFCRQLKKFKENLSWDLKWACQMRVDKLDEEMIDVMKGAGFFLASYGFESYSPVILTSMKKYIKPEQIHRAVHITLDKKINLQANFIFGDIAETAETAEETLNFWKEHSFACIMLDFILPLPDSQLYRYCIEKGIIKDRLDFIKNHIGAIYNMTQLSDAEFYKLWVNIIKTGVEYAPQAIPLSVSTASVKVKCPHCNEVIEYKNFDINSENSFFIWMLPIPPNKYYFSKVIHCRICARRFYAVSRLFGIYKKMILLFLTPGMSRIYLKYVVVFYRKINPIYRKINFLRYKIRMSFSPGAKKSEE